MYWAQRGHDAPFGTSLSLKKRMAMIEYSKTRQRLLKLRMPPFQNGFGG